ncbi:MAG: TadG family pilus assembly protein, partial [Paracoccaceae bacterium]
MATLELTARLLRFLRDEDGAATAWSVSWALIFFIIGGLTIDNSSAWKSQQELQAVADAASHAGAVELGLLNDESAKEEAVRVARLNLPVSVFGNVLAAADVETGNWDHDTRTFTPATAGADAVRVLTKRMSANGNAVPTFLLRLIGFNKWDIVARSTTQRFVPSCIMDGIVSVGVAEISSNNSFYAGYCIHGQAGVKISSNNFFEGPSGNTPGVRVSMNDLDDLQLPGSGFSTNTGLEDALGEDWMNPR